MNGTDARRRVTRLEDASSTTERPCRTTTSRGFTVGCAIVLSLLAESCKTAGADGYGVGVTLRGALGVERFQGPTFGGNRGSSSASPASADNGDKPLVQAASVSSSQVDDGSGTKVDVGRGFGAQVAWMTPYVDVTTGLQRRKYGSLDTTEGTLGVRRRLYVDDAATPYVFFELRHTRHENRENEFFNGFAAGLGAMFHWSPHVYVDANLAWERTAGLGFGDQEPRWDEGVLQIGLGGMW